MIIDPDDLDDDTYESVTVIIVSINITINNRTIHIVLSEDDDLVLIACDFDSCCGNICCCDCDGTDNSLS